MENVLLDLLNLYFHSITTSIVSPSPVSISTILPIVPFSAMVADFGSESPYFCDSVEAVDAGSDFYTRFDTELNEKHRKVYTEFVAVIRIHPNTKSQIFQFFALFRGNQFDLV